MKRRDFLACLFYSATLWTLGGCRRPSSRPPKLPADKLIIIVRDTLPTYSVDEYLNISGFEADLLKLFASEIGRTLQFIIVDNSMDALRRLEAGEAHMAAAWLSPDTDALYAPPYFETGTVFVQHESATALGSLANLAGKKVHGIKGSRQEQQIQSLTKEVALEWVGHDDLDELGLLEQVAKRQIDIAIVDTSMADMGCDYWPILQKTLTLETQTDIVWRFNDYVDAELIKQASVFIAAARKNGTVATVKDRYFGHVQRLNNRDMATFLERIDKLLPAYRTHFKHAQEISGFDWRLLAALAYQESGWNPEATSPTGVRGMMMLTNETAEFLKVANRLDPAESIRAGARYLGMLHGSLPQSVVEPDRTWMALAAYNLGQGHVSVARNFADSLNVDPDRWYGMKQVLPLLARPEYYNRSKYGRARGGEAVILVENIRAYYETLSRHEPAHNPEKNET